MCALCYLNCNCDLYHYYRSLKDRKIQKKVTSKFLKIQRVEIVTEIPINVSLIFIRNDRKYPRKGESITCLLSS